MSAFDSNDTIIHIRNKRSAHYCNNRICVPQNNKRKKCGSVSFLFCSLARSSAYTRKCIHIIILKMLHDGWNLTIKSIYFCFKRLYCIASSSPLEINATMLRFDSVFGCINLKAYANVRCICDSQRPILISIDVVEHANKMEHLKLCCNRCYTSSNNNAFSK